jgi:hypothetical protein
MVKLSAFFEVTLLSSSVQFDLQDA